MINDRLCHLHIGNVEANIRVGWGGAANTAIKQLCFCKANKCYSGFIETEIDGYSDLPPLCQAFSVEKTRMSKTWSLPSKDSPGSSPRQLTSYLWTLPSHRSRPSPSFSTCRCQGSRCLTSWCNSSLEFGAVFSHLVLQAGSYDGRVSGPPPPICVITGTPGDRGLVHSKCVNMQIPFESGWGCLRGCISNDLPRDADAGTRKASL